MCTFRTIIIEWIRNTEEINLYSNFIDIEHLYPACNATWPPLIYNENNQNTWITKFTNSRTLHVKCALWSNYALWSKSSIVCYNDNLNYFSNSQRNIFSLAPSKEISKIHYDLDSVMLLHIHKDKTDDIDLLAVAKEFISLKSKKNGNRWP